MRRTAYFFDLGGTLLALDGDEIAHDARGRATILPGVAEAFGALAGQPVFVVTNQSGLGEGRLEPALFDGFCAQLDAATAEVVTQYAVCAHRRDAGCACRKPRPGLVLALATAHDLDLAASLLVGDAESDRLLAEAAGIGRFTWAADYFAPHGHAGAR